MSRKDLTTQKVEARLSTINRALDILRAKYNVGFLKEELTPAESAADFNALDGQGRLDMLDAMGEDTFYEHLDSIGVTRAT